MTVVLDASALAELVLSSERGPRVEAVLGQQDLVAPQLIVVEMVSILRGWVRGGRLSPERAAAALQDVADLGVELVDMAPLALPAWELRDRATSYDAVYVALAQRLGLPLVTCDEKLAREFPGVAVVP